MDAPSQGRRRDVILFSFKSDRGVGLVYSMGGPTLTKNLLESVANYKLNLVFVAKLAVVSHFCELIAMENARGCEYCQVSTSPDPALSLLLSLVGRR